MSFDIDVAVALGGRTIAARFVSGGGITVLHGRSGAGKTSVLNMVAGLLRPARGHVRIGAATVFDSSTRLDLPPERRRLGYVFQDTRLFAHRRVRANLTYGYRLAAAGTRRLDIDETVALLGIGHLLDRWPRSLSGGEAQRVAIGRALLSGPEALLMDEPLTALDPERRGEILTLIERIRDTFGLPILYVTHDIAEAERLATTRIEIG